MGPYGKGQQGSSGAFPPGADEPSGEPRRMTRVYFAPLTKVSDEKAKTWYTQCLESGPVSKQECKVNLVPGRLNLSSSRMKNLQ